MRNEKQKVRISDIFYTILKEKRLIAILTLAGLILGIMISVLGYIRGEMTKQYKITASAAVSAQTKTGAFASRYTNPNKDDFNLAMDMTDSAMYVVASDQAIAATIEKLGMVGVSVKSIKNNLTLKQYNETQIIEMALLWRNEEEGINILSTLTDVSDEILINTLKIGNLTTVNPPTASYIFGGNIKITTLIYAAVLGLFTGIAVSIFRLLAFPKLLKPEDMETLFGLEVMASIPYNTEYADSSPFSDLPEAEKSDIGSAAHILLNRLTRAGVNRVYFTSTGRKEGKTKLMADLAVKLSNLGKKVLVVDCDFSNPTLSSAFGINTKYENSLNAIYRGDCDKTDAVVRLTGSLFLLGSVLDNKAEAMSDPMFEMLKDIFDDYDYVLIDSAPIGKYSEVIMLNEIAQAAFFIVKADSTELSDIRKALLQISKSGEPIAGCIVNGTKTWKNMIRDVEKLTERAKKKKQKSKDKSDTDN